MICEGGVTQFVADQLHIQTWAMFRAELISYGIVRLRIQVFGPHTVMLFISITCYIQKNLLI